MFMILAPRVTPTGPPKFSLHKEQKDQGEKDARQVEDHKDGDKPRRIAARHAETRE